MLIDFCRFADTFSKDANTSDDDVQKWMQYVVSAVAYDVFVIQNIKLVWQLLRCSCRSRGFKRGVRADNPVGFLPGRGAI
jgi:hypothetical protein